MQVQVLPCAPSSKDPPASRTSDQQDPFRLFAPVQFGLARQPSPPMNFLPTPFGPREARVGLVVLALVGVLVGTTGCDRRYVITTTGGAKIVTASKPKLVQSRYIYRDANGRTNEISTMRVRVVEPYSSEAEGVQRRVPELQ